MGPLAAGVTLPPPAPTLHTASCLHSSRMRGPHSFIHIHSFCPHVQFHLFILSFLSTCPPYCLFIHVAHTPLPLPSLCWPLLGVGSQTAEVAGPGRQGPGNLGSCSCRVAGLDLTSPQSLPSWQLSLTGGWWGQEPTGLCCQAHQKAGRMVRLYLPPWRRDQPKFAGPGAN